MWSKARLMPPLSMLLLLHSMLWVKPFSARELTRSEYRCRQLVAVP